MRLFLQPPRRTCAVCERPAQPHDLVCVYCGEDLPQRRRQLCQRAGIAGAALFSTAAFAAVHGWPPLPGKLPLPGAALLALGVGLALLPPRIRGVADSTRHERLRQVMPRYFGGVALAVLAAIVMLAACAPRRWAILDAMLATITTLTLLAAPPSLGLPWHKLAAGALFAAGLLLSPAAPK